MKENRSSTGRARRPGFTPQQTVVLIFSTLLGLLCLGWLALALFSPGLRAQSQAAGPQATQDGPGSSSTGAAANPAQDQPTPQAPALPACMRVDPSQVLFGEDARAVGPDGLAARVNGQEQRYRLAGLLPPADTALSAEAEARIQALLDGEWAALVPAGGQDASAAYVFQGDRLLNTDLLQRGLARTDPQFADGPCANLLQQAEQQARIDRSGVWKPTRVPTATFLPMVTLDPALQPPCDCSARPTCEDFQRRGDAQACYNACNDYNSRLDDDRDGIACEELPETP